MNVNRPLEFSQWESSTQSRLYRGQVDPLRKWIGGTVLDVASNYGRFSALTAKSTSVDIEMKFLRRGIELGNITQAVVASALSLPFKNRTFDTVLAMGIIDHIPWNQTPRFLDELVRVAKDIGAVIIQVASPYSFLAAINLKHYGEYVHPYSPFLLMRQLRKRGWRLAGTLSSGLAGRMDVMPYTADGFLPWAVHLTMIFVRRNTERAPMGRSLTH